MTIHLEIEGLDRLQAKFERMGADLKPELIKTTHAAMLYANSQVPPYPPQSRKPYKRQTAKQRRYVMAAIRRGDITVPYPRKGSFKSLTTEVQELGSSIVGLIGTNTPHAPWVISSEAVGSRGPQARYHEGNWWRLQEVVRNAREGMVALYQGMVHRLVNS